MTDRWVLVLDAPSGDACRRVGGLPLALRLALDAQAGGAAAVVITEDAAAARPALDDARLRLPLLDQVPDDARSLRVPASWVVHRALFRTLVDSGGLERARDLAKEPFGMSAAWSFEPVDVTDDKSAERAERALFTALRKPQDGWTSRWLNRYISLSISRWLVNTPLRPNQVSIGILAIGLFGAWLATRGDYLGFAVGAFLFQMQSVLDGCDGEMSRVTYRGSHLGEWLDTIGDDLTNYAFFAGAAVGLYRSSGHTLYLLAGSVIVFCGFLTSGIEYRYLIRIGSGDLLKYPLSQGASGEGGGLLSAIQPLFKRDTFVFLTFVAALVGLVGPMLIAFSLGAIGIFINVIATELRMAKSPRRPGSER
jgi:CDP-L-myo-inositol myo-inositolphosphotransferase